MVTPYVGHYLCAFEGTERAELRGGEPESRGQKASPLRAEILKWHHSDASQRRETPGE